MISVSDIIDQWRTGAEFARDLGLKGPGHAHTMRCRGFIHVRHWPRIISAAKEKGIVLPDGRPISADVLLEAHSQAA